MVVYIPTILAFGWLRQESSKFKSSLVSQGKELRKEKKTQCLTEARQKSELPCLLVPFL